MEEDDFVNEKTCTPSNDFSFIYLKRTLQHYPILVLATLNRCTVPYEHTE